MKKHFISDYLFLKKKTSKEDTFTEKIQVEALSNGL